MKTVLSMMILFGCLSFVRGQSSTELRDMLRQEGGHTAVAKLINEPPLDRRQDRIETLVNLVRDELLKSPSTSGSRLISNASAAFIAIGDEQAMLTAFQDGLADRHFSDQLDVAEALATCHSDRAVVVIEQLVRNLLGKLGVTLVRSADEDEGRARNDLLGSFIELLKRLAKSANPSSGDRAKKIRDEFAALYATDNGKLVLAALDAELAKITQLKSTAVSTPQAVNSPSAQPTAPKKPSQAQTTPTAQSEERAPSPPWSIIVVLIVAATGLLWLVLKRRS